jgi:polyhydroxyalkanoate synthesis regulator phasin
MRERVLTADLERLRAEAQTEQQDLAQAVFGLNAFLEKLGMEYAKIGELNEEEKALVRVAEEELALARTARTEADEKWFFKQSAIDEAESAIEVARRSPWNRSRTRAGWPVSVSCRPTWSSRSRSSSSASTRRSRS